MNSLQMIQELLFRYLCMIPSTLLHEMVFSIDFMVDKDYRKCYD